LPFAPEVDRSGGSQDLILFSPNGDPVLAVLSDAQRARGHALAENRSTTEEKGSAF